MRCTGQIEKRKRPLNTGRLPRETRGHARSGRLHACAQTAQVPAPPRRAGGCGQQTEACTCPLRAELALRYFLLTHDFRSEDPNSARMKTHSTETGAALPPWPGQGSAHTGSERSPPQFPAAPLPAGTTSLMQSHWVGAEPNPKGCCLGPHSGWRGSGQRRWHPSRAGPWLPQSRPAAPSLPLFPGRQQLLVSSLEAEGRRGWRGLAQRRAPEAWAAATLERQVHLPH